MKGTIEMELRDIKRISDPDEAVDAIIRLAEVVEEIRDKVARLEAICTEVKGYEHIRRKL